MIVIFEIKSKDLSFFIKSFLFFLIIIRLIAGETIYTFFIVGICIC